MKEQKAITLIALIVTIIVLLILAGVTINMVLGDNGLFNKAKTSVAKYENAQEKENSALGNYENEINTYINGNRDYVPLTYSTNEQKTGQKWINGEDIYIKTLNIGTFTAGNWINIQHNISSIDVLINYFGQIYLLNNSANVYEWMKIGTTTGDSTWAVYSSVNNTNVSIFCGTSRSFSTNSKGYITLMYTKK